MSCVWKKCDGGGASTSKPTLPDGLRPAAEAAAKLRCSIKTLNGHVESGALRYVVIGHGTKRPRRMFTDADLNEFIANQTRKDVPCPSSASNARRIINSTSSAEVIAFHGSTKCTARREAEKVEAAEREKAKRQSRRSGGGAHLAAARRRGWSLLDGARTTSSRCVQCRGASGTADPVFWQGQADHGDRRRRRCPTCRVAARASGGPCSRWEHDFPLHRQPHHDDAAQAVHPLQVVGCPLRARAALVEAPLESPDRARARAVRR